MIVDKNDPRTWKKPTRVAPRYENRAAKRLRSITFQKVALDKKFWYVDVEYRRTVLTRDPESGKLYNAVAVRNEVNPRFIEMDEGDVVTIIELEEILWNEW